MTQDEYEGKMFETQIELNRLSAERMKAEIKLMEIDAQTKEEHLRQLRKQGE